MFQSAPGVDVESPREPDLHRHRQREPNEIPNEQPSPYPLPNQRLPSREHGQNHPKEEDGHGKHQTPPERPPPLSNLPRPLERIQLSRVRRSRHDRVESESLDLFNEVSETNEGGGVGGDAEGGSRVDGGEDGGGEDSGDGEEGGFDEGEVGRRGEAVDVDLGGG